MTALNGRTVSYVVTRDLSVVRHQAVVLCQLREQARQTPWRRDLTLGAGWSALLNAIAHDEDDELLAGAMRVRLEDLRALRRGEVNGADMHPTALIVLSDVAGLTVAEAAALLVVDCLGSLGPTINPVVGSATMPAVDATGDEWTRTIPGARIWRLTTTALGGLLNQLAEAERVARALGNPSS